MGSVFYAIRLGDKIITIHDVKKKYLMIHTVLQQRKTKLVSYCPKMTTHFSLLKFFCKGILDFLDLLGHKVQKIQNSVTKKFQ